MESCTFWKEESQLSPMGLRREYIHIGGDLEVGALLSQIVYWHRPSKLGKSKLRVVRDGNAWIAKTREEWMEECQLSEWGYRRAISVLRQKGLIEVRVMRFNGLAMNHTRLLVENLKQALKDLSDVSKGHNRMCPKGTTGVEKSSQPIARNPHNRSGEALSSGHEKSSQPLTEITTETTTEITRGNPTSLSCKKQKKIFSTSTTREMKMVTAGEILKNKQNAKLALHGDSKKKKSIAMLWQELSSSSSGKFQKPLTSKDLGQLKKFAVDVGEIAPNVLQYVFQNWWKFAHAAKAEAGLENCPSTPNIGYLLKYQATAVNLYLQSIAMPVIALVAIPQQEVKSEVPEDEKPYIPSPDELQVLLAGLKEA